MDSLLNKSIKCKVHPKNKLIYIQVNEISQNKSILYCEECVCRDFDFKPYNYIRIKQIVESQDDSYIFCWPPLDDPSIQQQIQEIKNGEKSQNSNLEKKINSYFDDLKKQIFKQIDECQKRAINEALRIDELEQQVLEEYQKISRVNDFKQIISDNIASYNELNIRSFLKEINESKEQNTKFLQRLLYERDSLQKIINFDNPQQKIQQILDIINSIEFFIPCYQEMAKNNQMEEYSNLINLLPQLKFTKKLDFDSSQLKNLIINKDQLTNQITFSQFRPSEEWSGQYYINQDLNVNKRYVFKLRQKQQNLPDKFKFQIGLLKNPQEENYDDEFNEINNCLFKSPSQNDNNLFELDCDDSISFYSQNIQIIKGNFQQLTPDTEISIYINIGQHQLEITDFPYQNHIFSVELDGIEQNIQTNYRFFISLYYQTEMILTQAIEY